MSPAPRPDAERLAAYLDGELDAAGRAEVDAALAADPALARRMREQQALRERIVDAYRPVLDEPLPERLLAAARGEAKVVDLASARAARQAPSAPRRWRAAEWSAMAASVVLGVLIGVFTAQRLPASGGEPFATTADGALVARGGLARALDEQLASVPLPGAAVRIGTSFVARSGGYCRSFVLERAAPLAGLACRDGGAQWRLQVVVPAARGEATAGGYRMAGAALPAALLQAIDDQIQGPPLDAAAEQAARQRGWR